MNQIFVGLQQRKSMCQFFPKSLPSKPRTTGNRSASCFSLPWISMKAERWAASAPFVAWAWFMTSSTCLPPHLKITSRSLQCMKKSQNLTCCMHNSLGNLHITKNTSCTQGLQKATMKKLQKAYWGETYLGNITMNCTPLPQQARTRGQTSRCLLPPHIKYSEALGVNFIKCSKSQTSIPASHLEQSWA